MLKYIIPPIHKEGYSFILLFSLVTVLFSMVIPTLGWVVAIATGWCVYFFRDPKRVSPEGDHLLLGPADGVITSVRHILPPAELEMSGGERWCISIFLNIFNVHVNRVPAAGTIKTLHYRPGKFISAAMDKSSEENERQCVAMVTADGKEIAFVQIAGLIARRIVCELTEGQRVQSGERFGIIRFGSRVDLYLPEGIAPQVIEGQQVIGGETVMADLSLIEQNQRIGVVR